MLILWYAGICIVRDSPSSAIAIEDSCDNNNTNNSKKGSDYTTMGMFGISLARVLEFQYRNVVAIVTIEALAPLVAGLLAQSLTPIGGLN